MTRKWSLRDVAVTQSKAFDDLQSALAMYDYDLAAQCAAIVSACALVRLAGSRPPGTGGSDVPFDPDERDLDREHDWTYREDDPFRRQRRLDLDRD